MGERYGLYALLCLVLSPSTIALSKGAKGRSCAASRIDWKKIENHGCGLALWSLSGDKPRRASVFIRLDYGSMRYRT